MATIINFSGLRQLLSYDLGKDVMANNAFDAWFSTFSNKLTVGFGDLSFRSFALLPAVKNGFWGQEINTALQAAKDASGGPLAIGTMTLNGERLLGAGKDFWLGSAGSDKVLSGGGSDVVSLGAGNDTAYGGTGQDLIFGEGGSDSLTGGAGADSIFGGADRDQLYGWGGNDLIFGGTGNDGLYGNEGNDTISGGSGNDYICGGSDKDVIFGGSGADTFAFRGQAPDSETVIKDFDVLQDKQLIMASVAGGPLTMDMIKSYSDGLVIEFTEGRAIYYEGILDSNALFDRMSIFE